MKRRNKRNSQAAAAVAEGQAQPDVRGRVGRGAVVVAVTACAGDDSSPQNATAAVPPSQEKLRGTASRSSKQALRQPTNERETTVVSVPLDTAVAGEGVAGETAVADVSSKVRSRGAGKSRQKQPMLSAAPAGAEVAPGVDAATVAGTAVLEVSADVDTASITPSARRGKRKARAAAADVEVPAAASGEGVAVQGCITPETAQPKRIRSRKAVPSAALPGDTAAVPVKPPRRTKKVIAEEVREAARLGQFGELTLLSEAYSHISLFTGIRNSQVWGELQAAVLDPAVAAAAGGPEDLEGPARAHVGVEQVLQQRAGADQHQHQHQHQVAMAGGIGACGTFSSSRALCKTSGLGSFKQQVWLHNTDAAGLQSANGFCQQQQQMAAEKLQDTADVPDAPPETFDVESYQSTGAGTPADSSSSSSTVIPNLGYACLCMTMRNYDVFNSRDCVKKTRNAPDGLQKVSQLALANAR